METIIKTNTNCCRFILDWINWPLMDLRCFRCYGVGISILHFCWFPKKGINGITAEPYEEYLKLINKEKHHPTKNELVIEV